MADRAMHNQALSPVLLLAVAAMLSIGSVTDGATATAWSGDQQLLTHLAEALANTAGAIGDDDHGLTLTPAAIIGAPLPLEPGAGTAVLPRTDSTPHRVRPLLPTLTNLPPPTA